MQARELMTTDPAWCTPECTVRDAAELMRLRDCGCIPVLERDSRRLVGVVTDRDIVCRAVAEGRGHGIQVRRIMTTDPESCHLEDDIAAVEQIRMRARVRRVSKTRRPASPRRDMRAALRCDHPESEN